MVVIFQPQYDGVKFHLQYSTSKGGKIHHPPARGGIWLIYVNLCIVHGTGIASIVMQLIV